MQPTPLYRFENPEPDVPKETDEPNVYGEVIAKEGEHRLRFDGKIFSYWVGPKCVKTLPINLRDS
jgi:hypothetical protein